MTNLPGDDAAIDDLNPEFVSWFFEHHPVEADIAGAPGGERTLGDYSASGFLAEEHEAGVWLTRYEQATAGSLDEEIDQVTALAQLRGLLARTAKPAWRSDPTFYLWPLFFGLSIPFRRGLNPEGELVENAVAKLAELPGVLADGEANIDPKLTSSLQVGRAIAQAKTGRHFLTQTLPGYVADDRLRSRLADAAEQAAPSFATFLSYLEGLEARAEGDWRMGEELYSRLLIEKEGLDVDAAGLHRRGREVYAELEAEIVELAARVDPSAENWRAAIERVKDDHPPTLEAMRAEYEAAGLRARDFLVERGLVSFAEGERCDVVPSPEYLRPLLAVASYMAPPSLSTSRVGQFFVPHTPDGAGEDEVRSRLRANYRAHLPTTAIHEAYPGHHWQLSWSAEGGRTVRKIFNMPYFTEGWALYTERMMREQGFYDDPRQELATVSSSLRRAARIVVDTALHMGEMSIEEAQEFMAEKAAVVPATAVTEVTRYCANPTQAAAYLTGALEIERMRSDYLAAELGDLRSFHDLVGGCGRVPLGAARLAASRKSAP